MIILWIRKKKADEQNVIEKRESRSFNEHDDIMKRFRLAHPDMNMVNSRDILTTDGNLLAPIQQVKLAKNMQN
jgi:predicted nucleic acid-binding OB-fold protein